VLTNISFATTGGALAIVSFVIQYFHCCNVSLRAVFGDVRYRDSAAGSDVSRSRPRGMASSRSAGDGRVQ